MTVADLGPALTEFQSAVASTDSVAALAVVDAALAAGTDPVSLLTEVVGAAQRVVGEKWQRGEWSVAEEHAATAVAMSATEAIAREVRRRPIVRGRVVVACAEREWHALPAMMIDCALRSDGWNTTLLGASTPALRLSQYLQDLGPDALAVSCSVLGSLPTTRRFIEASRAAGIPVLVGGPAFGPDDLRARGLGATAWAADASDAIEIMRAMPAVVSAAEPLPAGEVAEQAALELAHSGLVADLMSRWPGIACDLDPDLVKDSIEQLLHAVWAALLTADPRPISQTVWWVSALLEFRAQSPSLLDDLRIELTRTLRDYPLATNLLDTSWP
ncbi:B12-binding domain-containing protein [Kribbella sp. NPDC004875]|uniref:cobalamin B12-binding domain-containing protein n=1 Tax=Kribbella sp. NPDC004875 TaxID=3364107 RepID=UPI003683EA96